MPAIDQNAVAAFIHAGQNAQTTTAKGRALEDLICYLFGLVPGISITRRNVMNVFNTEEIDVALWNEKHPDGIPFIQEIILVECKNWSNPVGSSEVSWFDAKLRSRGLDFGLLVAVHGITGDAHDLTAAHHVIAGALRERRRLIVATTQEITLYSSSKKVIAP